jgi:arylsulfatase A-like enzyme
LGPVCAEWAFPAPGPGPIAPRHCRNRSLVLPLPASRRFHVGLTLAMVGMACSIPACTPREASIDRPIRHVILISVDTLRADHLNCYGYRRRRTSQNIDALARDGILFENHIAASPWTVPSHMSLLTSLHPTAHGVTQSFQDLVSDALGRGRFNTLSEERTTLSEVLQAEGYETAAFTGGGPLDPKIGFGQGFASYDTSMYKMNEVNVEAVYSWIRQNSGTSFFLFWHNFEVHAPYLNTEFLGEVLPPERAIPISEMFDRLSHRLLDSAPELIERQGLITTAARFLRQRRALTREVTESLYDGGILSFDRYLGELLQLLRDGGLYDRSLIIVTSDHGEEFADHSRLIFDAHGHSVYEEMVRVPLIIKLPDQQHAGTRVEAVVRNIDVMPTVLHQLSISPHANEMQGTHLQPLWESSEPPPPRLAFSEALAESFEMKSVRTARHKYILSIASEDVAKRGRHSIPDRPTRRELFDLLEDPKEQQNLFESERRDLAKLTAALDDNLRAYASQPKGGVAQVELEEETIGRLKALGYLE